MLPHSQFFKITLEVDSSHFLVKFCHAFRAIDIETFMTAISTYNSFRAMRGLRRVHGKEVKVNGGNERQRQDHAARVYKRIRSLNVGVRKTE